jgi:hypothetical protein
MQLVLENIENVIAETQEQIAAVEKQIETTYVEQYRNPRKHCKERKLPDNLPRIEQVIEPASIACPCGCGDMGRIGKDRSELADWMVHTGALIAPVGERMAVLLKSGSSRLYVDETTAQVLDPGRGTTKTGYLWAVLRDDQGWGGPAPPGVVFHQHPGRIGQHASDILAGLEGTIDVDTYVACALPKFFG